jgi:hypothetical protein
MKDGGKLLFEARNVMLDEAFLSVHADIQPGPFVLLSVSGQRARHPRGGLASHLRALLHHQARGGRLRSGGWPPSTASCARARATSGLQRAGRRYDVQDLLPQIRAVPHLTRAARELLEPTMGPSASSLWKTKSRCAACWSGRSRARVIACTPEPTPAAALAWAKPRVERSNLLITDVVMAGDERQGSWQEFVTADPSLGYGFSSSPATPRTTIVHRGVLDEGVDFVAKPFSLPELRAKLREVLER